MIQSALNRRGGDGATWDFWLEVLPLPCFQPSLLCPLFALQSAAEDEDIGSPKPQLDRLARPLQCQHFWELSPGWHLSSPNLGNGCIFKLWEGRKEPRWRWEMQHRQWLSSPTIGPYFPDTFNQLFREHLNCRLHSSPGV